MSGFPYTITPPTQRGPYPNNMNPYYYFDSDLCPSGSSPSSTSSNAIPTPPTTQTPLLPLAWNFTVPLFTQFSTCLPNTSIESSSTEIIRKERPAAIQLTQGSDSGIGQHRAKGQQTLLHTPTIFSPADDTLFGLWAPIPAAFPTPPPPPPSPKLHQPRPSRRIPIVDLDKLASACETHLLQGKDRGGSEAYSPWSKQMSTGLFTPISKPGLKQPSVTNDPVLLCSCGCMGSY